jgi:hypothetical protein
MAKLVFGRRHNSTAAKSHAAPLQHAIAVDQLCGIVHPRLSAITIGAMNGTNNTYGTPSH